MNEHHPDPSPGLLVAEAAWPEVAHRAGGGCVGVLPIGAASKEHGPHLPMNTDWRQAEWLGARLAQRRRVLVWPTIGYGFYPAFAGYPGSISLSEATFVAMVGEVLVQIGRAGVGRCLLLNTGVSTIRPLQAAMAQVAAPAEICLANVYSGPRFLAREAALREQPRGGHADEIETSIMLAIAPGAVEMSRAVRAVDHEICGPPGEAGDAGSGVYGDPTLASAEKGRRLLEAMLEDLLDRLEAMGAAGR